MALVRTTNSVAIAAGDQSITVASATSIAAGRIIQIDNERMKVRQDYTSGTSVVVLRGWDGTASAAHAITSGVVHGDASDFTTAPAQTSQAVMGPLGRVRTIAAYGAAGAIALPQPGTDAVAIINGTAALAMTLANPAKDNDGDVLCIVGNGKAAHTVTYTAGLGNAGSSYDVGTFDANGQCCLSLIAANEIWVPLSSPLSGTLTSIDIAIA
ncbi:MAG: hypothetical protein FJ271_25940 [Planctomycetes bacterium]|nr:hypothetical protein [Planctomycetota bacterium]